MAGVFRRAKEATLDLLRNPVSTVASDQYRLTKGCARAAFDSIRSLATELSAEASLPSRTGLGSLPSLCTDHDYNVRDLSCHFSVHFVSLCFPSR